MEWRAYLAKPERIKKNALYRINGSAPRQKEIPKKLVNKGGGFFYLVEYSILILPQ